MFQSVGIVCAALILGIVVKCHARHGMDHGQWAREKPIACYECNSEYDPRCGDPFDPYTIGIVNCSMKRPLNHIWEEKPKLCRKTVQKVQGHIRVIRGCGYILDDRDDKECLLRTGTKDVHVKYCSCTRSLCNTGSFHSSTSRIIAGGILLGVMRLILG
ncbi:uncharacterized protein LOC123014480 [Tribolium madens]|uniref:uncharacterized protein LOC123014480 n=1 Tax=Tribolium madens TaxID=41895 RepID=UPI001CF73E50|nr:uncharacterized protein LOC123014480 [Tribolium madens]